MTTAGTDRHRPGCLGLSSRFNGTDAEGARQRHPFFDNNEFVNFDMVFEGVEGEDSFTLMSHGTDDDYAGLLIDSIQIHDWIV